MVITSLGLGSAWGIYQLSKVTSVTCSTQYGECIPEISNTLEAYQGTSAPIALWHIKHTLPALYRQILAVEPTIEFDRNIDVILEVEPPAMTVTTKRLQEQGKYFPVSFNGIILGVSGQNTPPLLILDQLSNIPGSLLTQSQIHAVQMVYHIASLGYNFQASMNDGNTIEVLINYPSKVASVLIPLNQEESPAHFVNTLQVILRQSTIATDSVQIDLRFAKPVVRDYQPAVAGTSTSIAPPGQTGSQ